MYGHIGPPPPPGLYGPTVVVGPPPHPMYGRPYGYGPRYGREDVICCCSIF